KIIQSTIVLLTGGLPDKAVERVLEKNLLPSMQDKKIIGASAGAVMQFKNYYISPDDDYKYFNYYNGLGFLKNDFYIEVHYENTDIQNECIKRVLNEKANKVYAITNNGGIIIENNKVEVLGEVHIFNN
ncbi:MAG: Type 1 glutamine amidotransferase-like domain-containing protein, partial [Clostridium sp.]